MRVVVVVVGNAVVDVGGPKVVVDCAVLVVDWAVVVVDCAVVVVSSAVVVVVVGSVVVGAEVDVDDVVEVECDAVATVVVVPDLSVVVVVGEQKAEPSRPQRLRTLRVQRELMRTANGEHVVRQSSIVRLQAIRHFDREKPVSDAARSFSRAPSVAPAAEPGETSVVVVVVVALTQKPVPWLRHRATIPRTQSMLRWGAKVPHSSRHC